MARRVRFLYIEALLCAYTDAWTIAYTRELIFYEGGKPELKAPPNRMLSDTVHRSGLEEACGNFTIHRVLQLWSIMGMRLQVNTEIFTLTYFRYAGFNLNRRNGWY